MSLSLAKNKIKILLTEDIHKNAVKQLNSAGYTNVTRLTQALSNKELEEKIQDIHIIGIRSRTLLTETVINSAPRLFAIGAFCIGTNQIDLAAARLKGIPVFNAPFSNTRSVAELVIAECIMLMRGVTEKSRQAHEGNWIKSAAGANEVRGKKLGIIGYGHIGTQVSILAEAVGMKVSYYDIEKKLPLGNAISLESIKSLLSNSDIITLHVPATNLTKNLIGEKEIAQMKTGSFLINASRGNIVDIPALAEAVKSGHIKGAAIDVFPSEPKSKDESLKSELQGLPNVILTPHIGGATEEAQTNIACEVAEKLVNYSDTGSTTKAVNFPEVSLPPTASQRRFLHIHGDTPGVLKKINQIFSNKKINIAAQYLQTDGDIGYVVFDVEDKNIDKNILDDLKKIPGTIRARMLY